MSLFYFKPKSNHLLLWTPPLKPKSVVCPKHRSRTQLRSIMSQPLSHPSSCLNIVRATPRHHHQSITTPKPPQPPSTIKHHLRAFSCHYRHLPPPWPNPSLRKWYLGLCVILRNCNLSISSIFLKRCINFICTINSIANANLDKL